MRLRRNHPRYPELGHQVVLLYLNRGEGIAVERASGDAPGSAPRGRKACESLKARAAFAGQYDGRAIVDAAHYEAFGRVLAAEKSRCGLHPVAHRPPPRPSRRLDAYPDAWLKGGRNFALYYYEVADDTMMFSPAEYVDISSVESRRRAACYAHVSQQPDKWYPKQVEITRARGVQGGFAQAEAFLRHPESKPGFLP